MFKERNKRSEKSLVKNSTLNVIKQISTLAFSLVTFPYVSRVIGSANYGKYSFAASIVEYLLLIAGAGSGTYAIREGARYRDNKSREEKFCSEIFSLNIITTIIAYAILAILFIFWGKLKSYADVLTVLSIRIVATTIGVEWIFSIYEDYLNITIRQIITQLVGLVLTLVLVRNETDYVLYAVATVVAMSGANVVNLFISRRYVNLHFTLQISKKHFKPVVYILFYSAMMTIYASSDITMMGILSTDRNVGIYSVASKIYGMAKNVFIAAMVPLIPRISYEFGQNDTKKIHEIVDKATTLMIALVVPCSVLLAIYSKETIIFISGYQYADGSGALRILSLALIFVFFGTIYTSGIMLPRRQERYITILATVSALCNVLLNLFFIPWLLSTGAAITTLVAEAIVGIGSMLYSWEYVNFHIIKVNLIKCLCPCAIFILVYFVMLKIISYDIIRLFVGGGISVILLITYYLLADKNQFYSIVSMIRGKK